MSDYERIAKAITYMIEHMVQQPTLDEVAAHLQLSPFHFQRLFSRWVGITPKKFLQVLSVERAKKLLAQPVPLLQVSDALGFSSGSRLYDHFVQLEAMTPGEYKRQGEGLVIHYGVHTSPFGEVFIAITERGICQLSFVTPEAREQADYQPQTPDQALKELLSRWPKAIIEEDTHLTKAKIEQVFDRSSRPQRQPLSLLVAGTNFQVQVWRALLHIPAARVISYGDIAQAIHRPKAVRAVGTAIGANPIAFLIPCHRVIQQSGKLGGYRWGLLRKQVIHAWESVDE